MTKPADTEVSTSTAVAATDKGETAATSYKVAELRDGVAIIEMDDGRMFSAQIADGVELRKRNTVALKFDESNKEGVPVDATVMKVL